MIWGGGGCMPGGVRPGLAETVGGPVDLGYKPSETDHLNVKL